MKANSLGNQNKERGIRKHIYGQKHTFELDVPPGFIGLCERWLKRLLESSFSKTDLKDVRIHKKLSHLRIDQAPFDLAHEFLLLGNVLSDVKIRIARGRCSEEEKLKQLIENIAWELWLPDDRPLEIDLRVNSVSSRLYHEGRLKRLVSESLAEILKKNKPNGSKKVLLPLNVALDIVLEREVLEVFLSLGGRNFWQRGQKQTFEHAAPLREDIAACLVERLKEVSDEWCPKLTPTAVLNPFCGTGTLLHETALHLAGIGQELSQTDEWPYQQFPFFRASAFAHTRKRLRERLRTQQTQIFFNGEDMDENLCRASQSWFESQPIADFLNYKLECMSTDSTRIPSVEDDKIHRSGELVWLLANPPFGLRLSNTAQGGTVQVYKKFAERIAKQAGLLRPNESVWVGLVLCPNEETWKCMQKTLNGFVQRCEHFTLGGIDLRAFYFCNRSASISSTGRAKS